MKIDLIRNKFTKDEWMLYLLPNITIKYSKFSYRSINVEFYSLCIGWLIWNFIITKEIEK